MSEDERSMMPRYRWIREQLIKMIIDRKLKGGDALESESQMAKQFGVALGTLRKAVDDLVARNVLERVQGKGTFVAMQNVDAALNLFHIVGNDGTKELPGFHELLGVRVRAAAPHEQRLLAGPDDKVVELKRTRTFSDGGIINESVCLSNQRFPDLKQRLGDQRPVLLYEFYEQEYSFRVVSFESRLRAVAATAEDAKRIGCAKGAPLLEVERLGMGIDAVPIELRTSRCQTIHQHYLHRYQ